MRDGHAQAATGAGRRPRGERSAARLWPRTPALPLLVTVGLLFALSGGLLWLVGLNYEGLQGSAASKIHPATYLSVLLVGLVALRSGNPVAYLPHAIERRPAAMLLIAASCAMIVAVVVRGAPGLAGAVDTYIGAAAAVLLLADADETTTLKVERLIHVIMTVNALMGLYEFLTGNLLFPYRFDGEVFPEDHRSSALQGHPLANAMITGAYVVMLMSRCRLSLPGNLRLPLIGLQFAALVVFGGRTALVTSLVFAVLLGIAHLHGVLKGGRLPVFGVAIATLLLTVVPLAVFGLAAAGFFDAIGDRFADDGGSAYARVEMFGLFNHIPFRDLLVGPDPAYVDSIRRIAGLGMGIENPVIRLLLYQGILITGIVTIAVVLFFVELGRITGPGTLAPILAYAFLLNTSESIGGKTTLLAKFAVMLIALYPREARRSAGRQP